jgi:N-acetylmuramoyl-L-alanine amidase
MREINKIIIHCTATPEGRNVSVGEIRRWHLARGWSDIGYHFVIGLDGTVYPGCSVWIAGAHTKGHNHDSIGIAYVGGVSADDINLARDTRTEEQYAAMQNLVNTLANIWDVTVHGHNEFAAKACPSFDVSKEQWIL